jgi:crotonobetainyl-CoA:carnitine CoA-transferase CaiB-like acyl-CoA transferase
VHRVGPLDGLTVVSLEQAVAAPYATRQLADLGARVIKIERLESGDFSRGYDATVRGQSSYFVWLNRSKESVELDVKTPTGQEVLRRLVERCDVVVQNLGPGSAQRLGIDAETLRARDPRLIHCSISGYGSTGSWSSRKAYDLAIQCETGLVSLTGTEDAPARVGISIADISAGMYAFSGVLSALYQRAVCGEGATIDISLFDCLVEWLGSPLYFTKYSGEQPARVGTDHPSIAPYGIFDATDGPLLLAVQNEREWARFCSSFLGNEALTGDPDFSSNLDRLRNRQKLVEIIQATVGRHDLDSAIQLLSDAGIACARVNGVAALTNHPVLQERGRWATVDSPGGSLEMTIPPIIQQGMTMRMDPIPGLGQHTERVLEELGYTSAQRGAMRSEGTIGARATSGSGE